MLIDKNRATACDNGIVDVNQGNPPVPANR